MPAADPVVPLSDSAPSTSEVDPPRTLPRDSAPLSRASRSPSDSSDIDWVSPFTLPPLPALRRARHQDSVRSPERLRHRDDSGTYYAAAWGSPYASPSPPRKPRAAKAAVGRGIDTDRRSRSPSLEIDRSAAPDRRRHQLRHSVDIGTASSPEAAGKLRARKQLRRLLNKSERPNWLSDSDSSGEEQEQTPKSRKAEADWSTLSVQQQQRRRGSEQLATHQPSDSLDTVTPDTFRVAPWPVRQSSVRNPRPPQVDSGAMSNTGVPAVSKPLSNDPPTGPMSLSDHVPARSPQSPQSPPRSSHPQPKKVPCKGRNIVISLPIINRDLLGLPPVLTAEELRKRLDSFAAQGWHISGFDLTPDDQHLPSSLSNQSRPNFPPSPEIQSEHQLRNFKVNIPNQQEWEDLMSYLREEKLRSLGVSPSNSELPPSVVSPLSQSLSRPSSKFTGPMQSPPVGSSCVTSDHVRTRSTAFSPTFSVSSALASQAGTAASSKHNAFPVSLHAYKHSLALGPGRGNSPLDLAALQQAAFAQQRRPPADVFARRTDSFSPVAPQGIRSLNQVCSPCIGTHTRQSPSYLPTPASSSQFGPTGGSIPPHVLPQTPTFEPVVKKTPVEIQHPTPRSHRHNLSAALQKEIDDAEAALARQPQQPSPILEREAPLPVSSDEKPEDDGTHELPILKRPEIVEDEKSDIITNPSIAPSPLLSQDKSPVHKSAATNWQALSNAALDSRLPSYTDHKPRQSLSGLNVQAKEFDPKAGFQSSNFSFTGHSFQPSTQPTPPSTLVVRKTRGPSPRQVPDSPFNVEAAPFVPRSQSLATQAVSKFRVSSSSFNVEAPEFQPDRSFSMTFGQPALASGTTESTSIFGKVQIDPGSKVQRRTSKPLPVGRPRSGHRQSQSPEPDGDDRRPAPHAGRAKRARHGGSNSDKSPVLAPSDALLAADIASSLVDQAAVKPPSPALSQSKAVDGWAYVPADESEITHEKTAQSPVPLRSEKGGQELEEARSSVERKGHEADRTAAETEPKSPMSSKSSSDGVVEVYEELSDLPPSPIPTVPSPRSRKHKSSLSALAEPFVFTPKQVSPTAQSHSASQPRTASGLAASRWAVLQGSPPSPPSAAAVSLHPRRQSPAVPASPSLHSDPALEDETDEEVLRKSVKVTEDPSSDGSEDEAFSPPAGQRGQISEAYRLDNSSAPSSRASPACSHAAVAPAATHQDEEDTRSEDDQQPSFEEIDAVMKQFEDNPELGIEREESPSKHAPAEVDLRFVPNVRSGARSLSPRRNFLQTETEASGAASAPPNGLGIGIHNLNSGKEEVSDWEEELSTTDEAKFQSRAQFFDRHVKNLVDDALENRLAPLEHTLHTIQHSISLLATKPPSSHKRLSVATDIRDSDADDEDDPSRDDDSFSAYRSRGPEAKRSRRTSQLRAAVAEAIATYRESLPPPLPLPPVTVDLSTVTAELAEMRKLVGQLPDSASASDRQRQEEIRAQQDHEARQTQSKLRIDELETMLKREQERADAEFVRRQKADEEIESLKQALAKANAQAAEYKESSDQAGKRLVAFVEEKKAYQELEHTVQGLERMIEEHGKLKEELQDALEEEKGKNRVLARTILEVKDQLTDRSQRCQSLHTKVVRLREQIAAAASGLATEQSESRTRENELKTKVSIIENALDQATRHAERVQLDMDTLERQHKEALSFKDRFENLQAEHAQAQGLIARLRNESRESEDKVYRLERELNESQSVKETKAAITIARLTAELEASKTQFESYKSEAESQVARLQSRLDLADQDYEDQKVKNDTQLAEMHDAHANAIRELNEKHQQAVEELHAAHDRKLGDLRDRHTRAMHNSSDDRHRMEHQFNEKLSLADDKIKHLEAKISDLTDRLDITKSAARAAVEAATAKTGLTNNLPTPANSVIASPPTRAASGTLSVVKREPEKISVQSLRESIIVLQEQLQNREQKIELLVAEIKALDPEAPSKLKECETEIQWLRELLAVRMDEIQELIATLSVPDFDRNAVKDAAIRLRANLEMEQSIREKSTTGQPIISAVPTLAQIATYAQSPRQALPLVASAALGNLRRAKQYAGDAYESYVSQTPSKSGVNSQGSFFRVITPPSSVAQPRRTDHGNSVANLPSPTTRPLAAAASASAGTAHKPLAHTRPSAGAEPVPRPLRGYSTQPRTLSKKSNLDSLADAASAVPSLRSSSPQTPISNPVRDQDLGDDVDEDASLLGRSELQTDETEIESR